jgi:hypothetical protein
VFSRPTMRPKSKLLDAPKVQSSSRQLTNRSSFRVDNRQKLGDEALTKESEVDTTVSEDNIIAEGTERSAKPAAGDLAEPDDKEDEEAAAEDEEDDDDDEEEEDEDEGIRPRRRAAQKADGYYSVSLDGD